MFGDVFVMADGVLDVKEDAVMHIAVQRGQTMRYSFFQVITVTRFWWTIFLDVLSCFWRA